MLAGYALQCRVLLELNAGVLHARQYEAFNLNQMNQFNQENNKNDFDESYCQTTKNTQGLCLPYVGPAKAEVEAKNCSRKT